MNKVWEKDYFGYMNGSEVIAVLCSGNYKVSNCYEVLLKGMAYPIYARDVGEIFFSVFFSLHSWKKFEKRTILDIWKDPNSLQCFLFEITKLGIAMNCSYKEGDILSMLVGFFNGIAE